MAWKYTDPSGAPVHIFFNGDVPTAYEPKYEVKRDGGYTLVAKTDDISSYCGEYECVENNDHGPGRASAAVSSKSDVISQHSFLMLMYFYSTTPCSVQRISLQLRLPVRLSVSLSLSQSFYMG